MPLTDKAIKAAKSADRPYKMTDGKGLYLLVSQVGGKAWKFKYRFGGKEKKLSLGTYPEITLSQARELLVDARRSLIGGHDPSQIKKRSQRENNGDSFEIVAREWLRKRESVWAMRTYLTAKGRLERFIFPQFGSYGVLSIEASDILNALRKIEADGKHELAHRVHQNVSQIFRYAIATGKAKINPAAELRGSLTPAIRKNLAHLQANELPDFLAKLDSTPCNLVTKVAALFLLHTFVRTAEMRFAKWCEIEWESTLWRIPKERMKMKRPHLVPLSKQTIKLLKNIQQLNGDYDHIFASPNTPGKPISENAVLYFIYRMGYAGKTTGHGFRSLASTVMNENGFHPDAIERQLAHVQGNGVRAAYNHAEYLDDRRKMMQWWSDYIGLRSARR